MKYLYWLIIFLSVLLFSPSLNNYFFGDDWFHLRITQHSNIWEFVNYFSFTPTAQSTTFYRPVSTQVFHFLFQSVFGLNVFPYRVFILAIFAIDLYLLYWLTLKIYSSKIIALLTILIFGVSATHFVKIYYLAATQEIIMLFFALLAIKYYLEKGIKNQILSSVMFILALLSRETAIVVPAIVFFLDWMRGKVQLKKLAPLFFIMIPYLLFRLIVFGGTLGDSYVWDFSVKRAFNTLFWYSLWAIGTPELLVDYVSGGLKVLPRFYSDFPQVAYLILSGVVAVCLLAGLLVVRNLRQMDRRLLGLVGIYLAGILPVLFLPWHKFALELTLAMLGFSWYFAQLISREKVKLYAVLFLIVYFTFSLGTNLLNYQTNYAVKRAVVSERIVKYLMANFSQYPEGKYFEFINDTPNFGTSWGSSKQIAQATSQSDLFKVVYKDTSVKVYFEDIVEKRPDTERIILSSAMFLK